ncbi:LLM class flavin-dependent oxidoreductase [Mesorhizobium sp. LSHC412B00]|uniref:LLM class flavin-dependent oxidoreductase n=1 Tax=Mesorhizobium sp. LSHC412B00 TaxID=1287285 RepID=UPI00279612AF|nr:LLM class flavin-dependent oxidoreductase [Mesorhizobium sp. LSHC412B00]
MGRRSPAYRQGIGLFRRSRQGPCDQPQGPALQGARTAQCLAPAAGPSADRPGRLVRRRKNFATAHADAHFAIYSTKEDGIKYRQDINERLARYGRKPESFKILPGILPIVAASEAEGRERQEYLQSLLPDRVGIDLLSSWSGVDLSVYPPDGPLPPLPDESTFNGGRTSLNRVKEWSKQNLTLREIARKLANSGSVPTVVGTPNQIADQLQDWFEAGAADGFNLMFPLLPEDWVNFAEQVVPELQRRGVFPTEYAPGTLRDRFGLARPANRFAEQRDNVRAVS